MKKAWWWVKSLFFICYVTLHCKIFFQNISALHPITSSFFWSTDFSKEICGIKVNIKSSKELEDNSQEKIIAQGDG